MQENTFPWIVKIIPAVVGALLALVLSGDIDKTGKIQVSMSVIGKFVASVTVSLYGGSAFIEHFEMLKTSTMYQGFIMLMFAVFGLLAIGILYQSIALLKGKPLPEVISEIKAAFLAIWGNGKGGND
jgi:Co/Zn/Cd efflux system component